MYDFSVHLKMNGSEKSNFLRVNLAVSFWPIRLNVTWRESSGSCITTTMEFSLGAGELRESEKL